MPAICALALSSGLGSTALVFSDDDVVHAAIEREGSQMAFAKRYGINRTYLNMILHGKKTSEPCHCTGSRASQSVRLQLTLTNHWIKKIKAPQATPKVGSQQT